MHHCFFCHGLRTFFSGAGAPSHGTGTQPLPVQPYGPPAGADSPWSWPSGAGLQAKAIRWASPRSSTLRYRWAWARCFRAPSNPFLGKAPLEAEHRALGHIQGLGYPGSRPALVGLEQDAGPVVTLPELLPARTMCSSWLRSSGVSRTANFSLTTPHLTATPIAQRLASPVIHRRHPQNQD